jgi:hypothetical protein
VIEKSPCLSVWHCAVAQCRHYFTDRIAKHSLAHLLPTVVVNSRTLTSCIDGKRPSSTWVRRINPKQQPCSSSFPSQLQQSSLWARCRRSHLKALHSSGTTPSPRIPTSLPRHLNPILCLNPRNAHFPCLVLSEHIQIQLHLHHHSCHIKPIPSHRFSERFLPCFNCPLLTPGRNNCLDSRCYVFCK